MKIKIEPVFKKRNNIRIFVLILLIVNVSCEKKEENLNINELTAVWKLDSYMDKNNNPITAPEIKISFLANKSITVFTSYNYGQGEFSIRGSKVTVSNLVLTDRAYDLENDSRFVSNLTGSYLINGDTLRILSESDFDMVLHKTQIVDPYQGDLSVLLIDTIESNRYYTEKIFDEEYSSVYGKWFLYSFYGGFSGGENVPRFDFLEIKENGIYSICKGFELLEYGQISIEKIISNEKIELELVPNNSTSESGWLYRYQGLKFSGNDTIFLHDTGCLDCYGYNFNRVANYYYY